MFLFFWCVALGLFLVCWAKFVFCLFVVVSAFLCYLGLLFGFLVGLVCLWFVCVCVFPSVCFCFLFGLF